MENTSLLPDMPGGELHKFSGGSMNINNTDTVEDTTLDENQPLEELDEPGEELGEELGEESNKDINIADVSIDEIINSTDPEFIDTMNMPTDDIVEAIIESTEQQTNMTGGGFSSLNKEINTYLNCKGCINENDIDFFYEDNRQIRLIYDITNDDIIRLFDIFMEQNEFIQTIGDLFIKKQSEKNKLIKELKIEISKGTELSNKLDDSFIKLKKKEILKELNGKFDINTKNKIFKDFKDKDINKIPFINKNNEELGDILEKTITDDDIKNYKSDIINRTVNATGLVFFDTQPIYQTFKKILSIINKINNSSEIIHSSEELINVIEKTDNYINNVTSKVKTFIKSLELQHDYHTQELYDVNEKITSTLDKLRKKINKA